MELKDFQKRALAVIEKYLAEVAKEKAGGNERYASVAAWEALGLHGYTAKKNGRDQDVPNFVMNCE